MPSAIHRKIVAAVDKDVCDGKDRQETILHTERRLPPLVEQFGYGDRTTHAFFFKYSLAFSQIGPKR